jgi:hypothetical protein
MTVTFELFLPTGLMQRQGIDYVHERFAWGEAQMDRGALHPTGRTPKIAWVAGALASVLVVFMIQNIWIDPWARHRSHRIPSLVPEAQSGMWFLAFAAGGIILVLLIVCLILLLRDRNAALGSKLGTALAVALVLLLGTEWFRVTNGQPGLLHLLPSSKRHKVMLTWQASSSQVVGYNVYRKTGPNGEFMKLNSKPIEGLSYTDESVESGVTYFYVTRSVDAHGAESANSNLFTVTVP